MTLPPDVIEKMERAMQESPAWPAVFKAGTAGYLLQAALTALEGCGYVVIKPEPGDGKAG